MKRIQTNSSLLLETVEGRVSSRSLFRIKRMALKMARVLLSFRFSELLRPGRAQASRLQLCCKGGSCFSGALFLCLDFWGGFWGLVCLVFFLNLCKMSLLE